MIIGLFLYEDFWKMRFWLVFKLEFSYRIIISWRIFCLFLEHFLKIRHIFAGWNIWVSSFALRCFLNVNGKAVVWWYTPCSRCNNPVHDNICLMLCEGFTHHSQKPMRFFWWQFFGWFCKQLLHGENLLKNVFFQNKNVFLLAKNLPLLWKFKIWKKKNTNFEPWKIN